MKHLAVFLLFLAIGITMYFAINTLAPQLATQINTKITNIAQQIPTHLNTAWTYITQHPPIIFSIIGGLSAFTGLFYKAYSNVKQSKQQAEEMLASTKQTSQATIDSVTREKDAEIATLKTQLETSKSSQADVSEITKQLASKDKQIQTLINEKNEAERILKVVRNPTLEDHKLALEREGYRITKIVS